MLRHLKKLLQIGNLSCCIVSVLVLAQLIVPVAKSFAQPPPFPELPKTEMLGSRALESRDTVSEARNGPSNLLCRVWRGETNNQVWVTLGDGQAFTITNATQTAARPSVVPYGNSQYMILHTGTDGRLYFTILNSDRSNDGWTPINASFGNTTVAVRTAPAATQLGEGNEATALAFLGADANLYFTTRVAGFGWQPTARIQGGTAFAAPAIAFNPVNDLIIVAAFGTNGHLWLTWTDLGAQTWVGDWKDLGIQLRAFLSPSLAVDPSDGTVMMGIIDGQGTPWFIRLDERLNAITNWGTNANILDTTFSRGHITGLALIFVSNVFWALWNSDLDLNFYGKVN